MLQVGLTRNQQAHVTNIIEMTIVKTHIKCKFPDFHWISPEQEDKLVRSQCDANVWSDYQKVRMYFHGQALEAIRNHHLEKETSEEDQQLEQIGLEEDQTLKDTFQEQDRLQALHYNDMDKD